MADPLYRMLDAVGPGAHALATQMLGNRDDAADAVQDALRSVLERGGSYDPGRGPYSAWFLAIVRDRCIDLLRSRGFRREVALEDDAPDWRGPPDSEPESALAQSELKGRLKAAISSLAPEHREIVILRDYLGLTYAEIGEVVGVPQGTVMSRLHRARLALLERLKDDAHDNL